MMKMPKSFVLTYSRRNTDIQDFIRTLKKDKKNNVSEIVCNAIRFYLKYKDFDFESNLNDVNIDNMRFSIKDIEKLKELFSQSTVRTHSDNYCEQAVKTQTDSIHTSPPIENVDIFKDDLTSVLDDDSDSY